MALNISAQDNVGGLIKYLPQHTHGNLVLNNSYTNPVSHYTVEIIRNHYENFELIDQEVLEAIELIGTNFVKIPGEYLDQNNIVVVATAHFEGADDVIETAEVSTSVWGGPEFHYVQSWKCIGSDYAYEIRHFADAVMSNSYLTVVSTANGFDSQTYTAIPYYQYYPLSIWGGLVQPGTYYTSPDGQTMSYTAYHDIASLQIGTQGVQQFENTDGSLQTANGTYITGIAVGVKKSIGKWGFPTSGFCLHTEVFNDGDISDILEALMKIDAHGSPVPCGMEELSCENTTVNIGTAEEIDAEIEDFDVELDTITWVWELFGAVQGIANLSIEENWYPYAGITISQLSGTENQILNLSMDDLLDNDNQPIEIPLNLENGLYFIAIQFADGSIYPIIDDKNGQEYNSNNMSNNLNVNIFPVPIEEDYFNMTLTAIQSVQFEYTLYTFGGEPIYSSEFIVENGNSETVQIQPEGGLPTGYYLNLFKFVDGSQMSILSVKNE